MTTLAYNPNGEAELKLASLGRNVDQLLELLHGGGSRRARITTFSELKNEFERSQHLSRSLLVVRIENEQTDPNDLQAIFDLQRDTVRQLHDAFGNAAAVAPIGNDEYAVLLLDCDQCGELIAKLDRVVARCAAGHLNGDGRALALRIGIARCPLDAESLAYALMYAGAAAAELEGNGPAYQFLSRRHTATPRGRSR